MTGAQKRKRDRELRNRERARNNNLARETVTDVDIEISRDNLAPETVTVTASGADGNTEIPRTNHSGGPVTVAGKENSRRNALKFGMTAKTLTLPHEIPDEIQARAILLYEHWQPKGPAEETLVDQIALAELRLKRIAWAEDEIVAEQVRNALVESKLEHDLRLLKYRRLLRRDRMTAILNLRSFGAGVSWLLSRWKTLESAFNAANHWNSLVLIREALLLRGPHDDQLDARTGSGYEVAHLAVSCVEGYENIPAAVHFLESCDDEGVPSVESSKSIKEFVTSLASHASAECLNRAAVREVPLSDARRTMRAWIERQVADLRELDRHFREADAQARGSLKVRAAVLADTPQNRLLIRYMRSTENTLDRALKTLMKLQRARQTAAEKDAEEAKKSDLRNEPKAVGRALSKDLVPGSCVRLKGRDYEVVETSDGNVILSPVNALVRTKPREVASPSENAA